jgi:hypothetical protein
MNAWFWAAIITASIGVLLPVSMSLFRESHTDDYDGLAMMAFSIVGFGILAGVLALVGALVKVL